VLGPVQRDRAYCQEVQGLDRARHDQNPLRQDHASHARIALQQKRRGQRNDPGQPRDHGSNQENGASLKVNRMISKCFLPGLPVEEGEPRRLKKSLRNYRGGGLKRNCQRNAEKCAVLGRMKRPSQNKKSS